MDNQDLIRRLKSAPLDLKVYKLQTNYHPITKVRSIYLKLKNKVEIEVDSSDPESYQVLLIE